MQVEFAQPWLRLALHKLLPLQGVDQNCRINPGCRLVSLGSALGSALNLLRCLRNGLQPFLAQNLIRLSSDDYLFRRCQTDDYLSADVRRMLNGWGFRRCLLCDYLSADVRRMIIYSADVRRMIIYSADVRQMIRQMGVIGRMEPWCQGNYVAGAG